MRTPNLLLHLQGQSREQPVVTGIVPVNNQAPRIARNLESLARCLSLPFVLLVLDDGSSDETSAAATQALRQAAEGTELMCAGSLYRYATEVFEAECDRFGLSQATTPFAIEAQADMRMTEVGFDRKLLRAIEAHRDVLMLSGRGTEPILPVLDAYRSTVLPWVPTGAAMRYVVERLGHRARRLVRGGEDGQRSDDPASTTINDRSCLAPSEEVFSRTGLAGRIGTLIELEPTPAELASRRVWIGETVMRGPLLIDVDKYREIGGLDADRFFLGYDEHDLAMRGLERAGYRSGYVPVGFASPLEEGSQRHPRSLHTEWLLANAMSRTARAFSGSTLNRAAEILETCRPALEVRQF